MMQTLSYWEKSAFFSDLDVVIIGSGIVGLNAAIRLREHAPHARIAVVERGPLPSGASTRNAGFACFGSPSELLDDLRQDGPDIVWPLVERRWKGLLALRQLLGESALGWEHLGGYELFSPEETAVHVSCLAEIDAYNVPLKDITGLDRVFRVADQKINSFRLGKTAHLLENIAEGQIDTGRMMQHLIAYAREKGIDIYNGLEIKMIEEKGDHIEIRTAENWQLSARQVLVATNGFARRLLPELAVTPARNQVLITTPLPQLAIRGCFHYNQGYVYFRNVGNRLLIGGFRNLDVEGETTDEFGFTPAIQSALEAFVRQVALPNQPWAIEEKWSGILGVGKSKVPIIRSVSERIHVAVRLGGMGVAIGTLVGREAAESLLESGITQ